MAFQLSPGINVSELDLTTVVPAVATTEGATVGTFRWGPTNERILVTSEVELVQRFGKPYTKYSSGSATWTNHESFFTAANFLAYSDALYVTRVVSQTAVKAASANNTFEAKYAGEIGDSLFVSWAGAQGYYDQEGPGTIAIEPSAQSGVVTVVTEATSNTDILQELQDTINVNDKLVVNNQELTIVDLLNFSSTIQGENRITTAQVEFAEKFITAEQFSGGYRVRYGYFGSFDTTPEAKAFNIIVIDKGGMFTGVPGTVLEKFENVSVTPGAKTFDGATNYIPDVLESRSNYIGVGSAWDSMLLDAESQYEDFSGGNDGASEESVGVGILAQGWDLYKNPEEVDISLLITGAPRGTALANYIIDNVAENRRDSMVFVSPELSDAAAQDIVDFTSTLSESTYCVVDTGYKYQYDKYNDVYRWVPLNGDVAGTCARTDDERDPWFSPAGYNRGNLKNVIKLKFNPNKTERDLLYKNNINPVIIEQGAGAVLFGDKTFKKTPSAFDRINVRRLFIVLEKAISVAAKATLFEFNDEFTRAQFVNLVEPFLRDVQGRRGIYDYKVICDGSNNTGEVIDRNEFVGDIYVKPARSINYIQLNFVAVRSGVDFTEIVR
jgi:hypothetical protein